MKHHLLKKLSFVVQLSLMLGMPLPARPTALTPTLKEQLEQTSHEELKRFVLGFYQEAETHHLTKRLPASFLLCHELLHNDATVAVSDEDLIIALSDALTWLATELEAVQNSAHQEPTTRTIRPDAPKFPVGPGVCDFENISRQLGIIRTLIGTTEDTPCDESILGILGDACTILGDISISQGIANLLTCCNTTFTTIVADFNQTWTILDAITSATSGADLSGIYTTLGNAGNILGKDATISGTLLDISRCCQRTYTTVVADFNITWTIIDAISSGTFTIDLSKLFTAITPLQTCCTNLTATVLREFNETWTILNAIQTQTVNVNFSTVFTALKSVEQCCNNLTATVLREFNETWTILNTIQTQTVNVNFSTVFTALKSVEQCCSNLTATVIREFNETWTILGTLVTQADLNTVFTALKSVETCCSNLTATVLRDFNETWTLLAFIDSAGTFTTMTDLSSVFTVLNGIQTCCNNLTATVLRDFNETWTMLALFSTPTIEVSANLSTVFTAIAGIQTCCTNLTATVLRDFNETWTILANLKLQVNFSTVFTALKSVELCCNNLTATVLRDFNETWTILNAIQTQTANINFSTVFTAIAPIQTCCTNLTATVLREFNETWTILNAIQTQAANINFSTVFTAIAPIQTCCTNLTATVLREFNETWTILNAIQAGTPTVSFAAIFTAITPLQTCCSNLTATVLREFNETWTILNAISTQTITVNLSPVFTAIAPIQTCCTNLTATVLREFNETWTMLNAISTQTITVDLSPVFTVLNVLTALDCNPRLIFQTDVNTTTYTISQPNIYILAENITFNPASAQRAIDITTSNVTLNLLCHVLEQGTTTTSVDGIRVASNLSNVTIKNGTIRNFTRAGISVQKGSSFINIDNVTTFSCNTRAIEFVGDKGSGNQITKSRIMGSNLLSSCQCPFGDNVLTLSHCSNVKVQNCLFNNNGSFGTTRNLSVANLTTCTNCKLLNLEMNDNVASGTIVGMNLIDTNQCIVRGCLTNNIYSAQADAFGMIIDGKNNNIQNNFIQNTFSTATNFSNVVAAVSMKKDSFDNIILDNTISNSTALSQTSSGVPIFGFQAIAEDVLNTGNLPSVTDATTTQARIDWSPNELFLGKARSSTAVVYEFKNNALTEVATFSHGATVNAVRWSPDGTLLAIAGALSGGANTRILDFSSKNMLVSVATFNLGSGATVEDLSWSPDGKFIAYAANSGASNMVRVLEFSGTGLTQVATFLHSGVAGNMVRSVSFSADQKYIAVGGTQTATLNNVRVLDFTLTTAVPTTLTSAANFQHGGGVDINSVAFGPTVEFVAMGGVSSGGVTTRVLKFDGSSLTSVGTIDHGATVSGVAWSADGKLIIQSGDPGTNSASLRLLRFQNNTLFEVANAQPLANVNAVWAPGNFYVAVMGTSFISSTLKLFNTRSFPFGYLMKGNTILGMLGGLRTFGFNLGIGSSAPSTLSVNNSNTSFNCDQNFILAKLINTIKDNLPPAIQTSPIGQKLFFLFRANPTVRAITFVNNRFIKPFATRARSR